MKIFSLLNSSFYVFLYIHVSVPSSFCSVHCMSCLIDEFERKIFYDLGTRQLNFKPNCPLHALYNYYWFYRFSAHGSNFCLRIPISLPVKLLLSKMCTYVKLKIIQEVAFCRPTFSPEFNPWKHDIEQPSYSASPLIYSVPFSDIWEALSSRHFNTVYASHVWHFMAWPFFI